MNYLIFHVHLFHIYISLVERFNDLQHRRCRIDQSLRLLKRLSVPLVKWTTEFEGAQSQSYTQAVLLKAIFSLFSRHRHHQTAMRCVCEVPAAFGLFPLSEMHPNSNCWILNQSLSLNQSQNPNSTLRLSQNQTKNPRRWMNASPSSWAS